MSLELYITPHGELRLHDATNDAVDEAATPALSSAAQRRLLDAFAAGSGAGLLHLATVLLEARLPPALDWARGVARQGVAALCQSGVATTPTPIPPPEAPTLVRWVEQAPPLLGSEYLDAQVLTHAWRALDEHVRAAAQAAGATVSGWLEQQQPAWRAVGRVTFHLAENKSSDTHPFAFLATYAQTLSAQGVVQHVPLLRAVQEQAGGTERQRLLNLLTPLERAAERVPWVRQLIDEGALFQPLAWTPPQAYAFLQTVEVLREVGLIVRTPDWWSARRPPRPQVQVRIGNAKQAVLSVETLLDISIHVALGDEQLTREELQALFDQSTPGAGLVRLRGRWVELDRDQLAAALQHWRQVEKTSGDGVSFHEAMRWLATGGDAAPPADAEDALAPPTTWVGIEPGPWLEQVLTQLRDPAALDAAGEVPGLNATLRPYQRVGVGWLRFVTSLKLGACLADDMGLGKTIQVLALLLHLKQQAQAPADQRSRATAADHPPPSLLVVPASLLANWRSELDRFAPALVAVTLHPAETRVDLKKPDAVRRAIAGCDLVITTYGMATRLELLRTRSWRLVILDEAQAIKNAGSRQSRAVKQLPADARLALSGTPVENRLSDLWSLFDFLNPGLLGNAADFKRFTKQLASDPQRGYAPLRRLVRPYILRRLKTDKSIIADLPAKTEMQTYCGLSKTQAALYQQSVLELQEQLHQVAGIQRRGLVLAFLMRFKQICNHPNQWQGAGDYHRDHSGKFQRLVELTEEMAQRQERVLVFTQFREITDPLALLLGEVFGRPGLILHGGTPVKRRQALVRDFQRDDGPPFFILSLKAGGTGLNLTAAAQVIHFDRWWNPAVENQATDRAFRIGQRRHVLVHKFVCRGTVEERIDALLTSKRELADAVLDADAGKMLTEMSDRELLDFVALDVNKAGEL